MTGIPPQLLREICEELLRCGPFDSDNELRHAFIDARLNPWYKTIPEAGSPAERVNAVVEFLCQRYNEQQENGLVLFLQVLSERINPIDVCHQRLIELAIELERTIPKYGPVPKLSEMYIPSEGYAKRRVVLNLVGQTNEFHCVFDHKIHLGRSPACDICLSRAPVGISNWHACVYYSFKTNAYYIQDLDSTNGVYVDNDLVEQTAQLYFGSKVRLGNSLTFLFEFYEQDPLATGTLIYHSLKGKELARYIVIPKDRVTIGNNINEAVKLHFLQPGCSLGYIIRRLDGFYYVKHELEGETVPGQKIEDGMEVELGIWRVRVIIRT